MGVLAVTGRSAQAAWLGMWASLGAATSTVQAPLWNGQRLRGLRSTRIAVMTPSSSRSSLTG